MDETPQIPDTTHIPSHPDRIESPPEVKLVPWPRAATAMIIAAVVAVALLAGSNIFQARATNKATELGHQIERSAECRFDKNVPIQNTNDRIDLWISRAIRSAIQEDQAGVEEALAAIDQLNEEFDVLVGERSNIVEECENVGDDD